MACLDRDNSVDVDVNIDHQHIAHLSCAQIVVPAHPRGYQNGSADRLSFLVIGGLGPSGDTALPSRTVSPFEHHGPNDERHHRIEQRISHQIVDNAATHRQRRCRILTRMSRIGDQQAQFHPLGHGQAQIQAYWSTRTFRTVGAPDRGPTLVSVT